MSLRPAESLLPREKRPQTYMGFAIQPDDHDLLDLLPEKQKEILLMKGDYKAIANALGVAVGTVRSRLHRARSALAALRRRRSQGDSVSGHHGTPIN